MIDIDQTRNLLISFGNMTEVAHVIIFQGYRRNSKGENQKVTVKICDKGSTVEPSLRYYCEATLEEGNYATGNEAASMEEVISTVHWNQLD